MKKTVLTFAAVLGFGFSALAVDVVQPPKSEDQKVAEKQAVEQADMKKLSLEQKRDLLKKKHAKRKQEKAAALEAAKLNAANAAKSNAISTDSTTARAIQDATSLPKAEDKREDKTR